MIVLIVTLNEHLRLLDIIDNRGYIQDGYYDYVLRVDNYNEQHGGYLKMYSKFEHSVCRVKCRLMQQATLVQKILGMTFYKPWDRDNIPEKKKYEDYQEKINKANLYLAKMYSDYIRYIKVDD